MPCGQLEAVDSANGGTWAEGNPVTKSNLSLDPPTGKARYR